MSQIEHFPKMDPGATKLEAPARSVTLLEDRAQVTRRGSLKLEPGTHKIIIEGVAPVLRDVSLRAEAQGAGRVADVSAQRAMRVTREQQPDELKGLEAAARELQKTFRAASDDRARAEDAYARVAEILRMGVEELPGDAGWGIVDKETWSSTFGDLFTRSRELQARIRGRYFEQLELTKELAKIRAEWTTAARAEQRFVAWVEVLIDVSEAGQIDLELEYVVPNALWRPMHHATLRDDGLEITSSAVVWQATGEDWTDAELRFSTAQSSLGTEPPVMSDDLLSTQRKSDEVVVQAREVKVQRTGPKGGGGSASPPPAGVELPGVDDGGEIRVLEAERKTTIRCDGRAHVVTTGRFETKARRERVAYPEIDPSVHVRVEAEHAGKAPLLAGPVELIQDSGTVGWTKTLFVAPGETFELGFGPDDAIRVSRKHDYAEKVDEVSRWSIKRTKVRTYLSNLAGDARTVTVTERIPVSEIEHVQIDVHGDETRPTPKIDDDGFARWETEVPANGHRKIVFDWEIRYAPDVRAR
jgi:uncharacterized protein (TIGR02231 family)